jgi:hypothetical protein
MLNKLLKPLPVCNSKGQRFINRCMAVRLPCLMRTLLELKVWQLRVGSRHVLGLIYRPAELRPSQPQHTQRKLSESLRGRHWLNVLWGLLSAPLALPQEWLKM